MPSVNSHLTKAKNSGTWKAWTNFWGKHNGTWKKPLSVHVKSGGAWVKVWDERPTLTITSNSRSFSNEVGPETIFTTNFTLVANGFNTTTSATSGGVETVVNGGTVAAGSSSTGSAYARYTSDLADNSSYYPTITTTNVSGTVVKQYSN